MGILFAGRAAKALPAIDRERRWRPTGRNQERRFDSGSTLSQQRSAPAEQYALLPKQHAH
jgi:hypothetical protein